ncbi:MAG: hypothetical protein AABY75_05375 [Bacteroidota bacterium]
MKDHAASAISLMLALTVMLTVMWHLQSQVAQVSTELDTARGAVSGLQKKVKIMQAQRALP